MVTCTLGESLLLNGEGRRLLDKGCLMESLYGARDVTMVII